MFDRHFRERVSVNESAKDELQFADHGGGLKLVAGSCVARHVREEDLLASGEQRLEEEVTIALGRGNIAGDSFEQAEIHRIAAVSHRKFTFAQPEHKDCL